MKSNSFRIWPGLVWPLYTGGRLQALKEVAALQPAQRYVGSQLARKVSRLRADAVTVAREHQHMVASSSAPD